MFQVSVQFNSKISNYLKENPQLSLLLLLLLLFCINSWKWIKPKV